MPQLAVFGTALAKPVTRRRRITVVATPLRISKVCPRSDPGLTGASVELDERVGNRLSGSRCSRVVTTPARAATTA